MSEHHIFLPKIFHPHSDFMSELGVIGRQERAAHFLYTLMCRSSFYGIKDGWVPVNARQAQLIYSDRAFKAIRELLIEMSIIEVNNSYCAGYYPKSMRINTEFINDFAQYTISSNFTKVLDKIENEREANSMELSPSVQLMIDNLSHLHIDRVEVDELIEAESNPRKQFTIAYNASKIAEKRFSVKVGSSGRVFHNCTNMPRVLRNKLQIEGQSLFEADIRTSQVLMLGLTLGDECLIKSCREQDVYMLLADWIFEFQGVKKSRKKVKDEVMIYILNACRRNGYPVWKGASVDEAFMALFPSAHSKLENSIRSCPRKSEKLIWTLQKREAEIMFNKVLPEVQNTTPKTFSVHDSVVVVDRLKDLAQGELLKALDSEQYN